MKTFKEQEEKRNELLNKKKDVTSRIKSQESTIEGIKEKIKNLKNEKEEIENNWKQMQRDYEAAYEISREQGLMKMNKNRSLNSTEIYNIMNRYDYDNVTRKKILSASGSKSKVNSISDAISKLRYEISQIQPILDLAKAELLKIEKEIKNTQNPTLF